MTVDTQRSGIDLSYVDPTIRPQDDLFGHVNGRWLADYTMPADRATDGAFRELYDRAEEHVHEIITAAAAGSAGGDAQRIGDLYGSFIDEQAVDHRGMAPLLDELARRDKKVFVDLKFFDIPATVAGVIRGLSRWPVTFCTIHGWHAGI